MIHFVGAGPGAPDLITIRGQKLLAKADVIIYAGSLVNPALLEVKKPECALAALPLYGCCIPLAGKGCVRDYARRRVSERNRRRRLLARR